MTYNVFGGTLNPTLLLLLCVYMYVQTSKKDSIGVRIALGETQIVTKVRQFLLDNGVVLDAFSDVRFR